MTDDLTALIAELRRLLAAVEGDKGSLAFVQVITRWRHPYVQPLVEFLEARLPALFNALDQQSADAELGRLIRAADERWPMADKWDLQLGYVWSEGQYVASIHCKGSCFFYKRADTLLAALRQLLGVDHLRDEDADDWLFAEWDGDHAE